MKFLNLLLGILIFAHSPHAFSAQYDDQNTEELRELLVSFERLPSISDLSESDKIEWSNKIKNLIAEKAV